MRIDQRSCQAWQGIKECFCCSLCFDLTPLFRHKGSDVHDAPDAGCCVPNPLYWFRRYSELYRAPHLIATHWRVVRISLQLHARALCGFSLLPIFLIFEDCCSRIWFEICVPRLRENLLERSSGDSDSQNVGLVHVLRPPSTAMRAM
eukprot:SAG11_NODE_10541_length_823_cov_1.377072_1_plen_147_part_00